MRNSKQNWMRISRWVCAGVLAFPALAAAAISPIVVPVTMSEAVNVVTTSGTPRIALDVGGNTRYATYSAGSGTASLSFSYAPTLGDVDLDGITITPASIDLNGGTIKDLAGNDISTLTFTAPNTSAVKVNYPSLSMDFIADADGRYTLNGTAYDDLTAFLAAAGGSFTRASIGTYYDSAGTLQTATSGTPRFDYDPVTHAAKGILIEESRTNLIQVSSAINSFGQIAVSVQTNNAQAPDGTSNADKVISSNVSSNTHTAYAQYSTSTAGTYTFSAYLKSAEYTYASLVLHPGTAADEVGIKVNLTNGSVVGGFSRHANTLPQSYSVQSVGNGWYRVVITQNFATVSGVTYHIWLTPDSSTSIGTSWTGDGVSGVYAWGAQLEQGSFATSYIPTTTVAVTRAADVITLLTSPWTGSDNETIFAQADSTVPQTNWSSIFVHNQSYSGNRYLLMGSNGTITGGFGGVNVTTSNQVSSNTQFKAGVTFQTSNTVTSLNGSAVTGAAVGRNSPSSVGIGFGNARSLNGHLLKIKYYPNAVTDTQLQLMTQ